MGYFPPKNIRIWSATKGTLSEPEPDRTMKHYIWAFLWAVIVLVLCSMPVEGTQDIPVIEGIDKLVHTGFFFVFTVLLYTRAIHHRPARRPGLAVSLIIIFISLLLAALTEVLQWKFFTYRSGDLWDLFADLVGSGMAVFAYLLLHRTARP